MRSTSRPEACRCRRRSKRASSTETVSLVNRQRHGPSSRLDVGIFLGWFESVANPVLCHGDHEGRFERAQAELAGELHQLPSAFQGKKASLQCSCRLRLETPTSRRMIGRLPADRTVFRLKRLSSVLRECRAVPFRRRLSCSGAFGVLRSSIVCGLSPVMIPTIPSETSLQRLEVEDLVH